MPYFLTFTLSTSFCYSLSIHPLSLHGPPISRLFTLLTTFCFYAHRPLCADQPAFLSLQPQASLIYTLSAIFSQWVHAEMQSECANVSYLSVFISPFPEASLSKLWKTGPEKSPSETGWCHFNLLKLLKLKIYLSPSHKNKKKTYRLDFCSSSWWNEDDATQGKWKIHVFSGLIFICVPF